MNTSEMIYMEFVKLNNVKLHDAGNTNDAHPGLFTIKTLNSKQLKNIYANIAKGISPEEIIVYASTHLISHSGKKGIVFTERGFYADESIISVKGHPSLPVPLRYEWIDAMEVYNSGNYILFSLTDGSRRPIYTGIFTAYFYHIISNIKLALCTGSVQIDAEAGDAEAQFKLGEMYYVGDGLEKDLHKAAKWYERSAEQGNAKSQHMIGLAYYYGNGVEKDSAKAAYWLEQSAEQGNPSAQCSIGSLYYLGEGIKQDYEKAAKWFSKSAKQGEIDSQRLLGICYYYGKGVDRDCTKAAELFQSAADRNDPESQSRLGLCYDKAAGVTQSDEKAREWYNKSIRSGNTTDYVVAAGDEGVSRCTGGCS